MERAFHQENPTVAATLLQVSIARVYDAVWALVMAAESLSSGKSRSTDPQLNVADNYSSDLDLFVPQPNGPSLLNSI